MKDPTTPAEWQEAVDLAEALSLLNDARLYGLVEGGPEVNVARCEELLEAGKARGYTPSPGCVERLLGE